MSDSVSSITSEHYTVVLTFTVLVRFDLDNLHVLLTVALIIDWSPMQFSKDLQHHDQSLNERNTDQDLRSNQANIDSCTIVKLRNTI